jgi:hypothetical protein
MKDNRNNPNQLPEGMFVARLGFFDGFASYLHSYERAVELRQMRVRSEYSILLQNP